MSVPVSHTVRKFWAWNSARESRVISCCISMTVGIFWLVSATVLKLASASASVPAIVPAMVRFLVTDGLSVRFGFLVPCGFVRLIACVFVFFLRAMIG